MSSLQALVSGTEAHAASPTQLQSLAQECCQHISIQDPVYRDELNDEREKTGQLRECAFSQLWPYSWATSAQIHDRQSIGLLIETRYQKTTYQVVLLGNVSGNGENACPVSLILFKAAPSHVKHIVNWLNFRFNLPSPAQLRLPPEIVLHGCSRFLDTLSASWTPEQSQDDALRQATLRQVIGSLKLTLTISNTTETDIAGKLRTVDFDVPSETVDGLLRRARQTHSGGLAASTAFLDELANAIHEKTGLRLPLSASLPLQTAQSNTDPALERPLKVSKITCAAFAITVDGKLKFARKPIESAEVVGYQETLIRAANWELLEVVRAEAEKRGARRDEDG